MATETQQYRAEARFQRVSPQKARLVLDLIRGQRVELALQTVAFTRKRVAPIVEKVLRSAIDNATYLSQERGTDLDVDRLFVSQAIANEGPRLKRIRPAPQGRAFHYQRRTSHIIVSVAEKKAVGLATTVDEPETEHRPNLTAGKTAGKKSAHKKTAAKKTVTKKAAPKKAAHKKKAAK
jgi:large subunit ribosomal protein L22